MRTLVAFFILVSLPAGAQTLRVTKVKGQQAIVNVTNGTVSVGQTIQVPSLEDDELELTASSTGPRKRLIGIDAGTIFSSTTTQTGTAKTTTNAVDLKARYGWNGGVAEYGVIGILGMSDAAGGGNATKFGAGGFFDWNFSPNRPGNDRFWGVGIEGTYDMTTATGGGKGSSDMSFFPSGYLKWFILKTPTALRLDLGYLYSDADNAGVKTKTQGFVGKAGFAIYF